MSVKKSQAKPVSKQIHPNSPIVSNMQLRDMLMDIKFSLDNLTHVVAIALGDKAKVVSTCPSCNGTGRDKTNEEGWKIGARYEGIKPCAVCKGEGRL